MWRELPLLWLPLASALALALVLSAFFYQVLRPATLSYWPQYLALLYYVRYLWDQKFVLLELSDLLLLLLPNF